MSKTSLDLPKKKKAAKWPKEWHLFVQFPNTSSLFANLKIFLEIIQKSCINITQYAQTDATEHPHFFLESPWQKYQPGMFSSPNSNTIFWKHLIHVSTTSCSWTACEFQE